MGSSSDEAGRHSDEGPQRSVRVTAFAMGVTEVSFPEWDACVADGGCGGYRSSDNGWGRGDRPVIGVSWEDAQAYVRCLNSKVSGPPYRLPSEAEWEYAARGGTTSPFWWGSAITPDQANYVGTITYCGRGSEGVYREQTVPVRSFEPNPFRLYQVHGNVGEWVQDCWNDSYLGAPSNGSAWMSGDCSRAVRRGGSWNHLPRNLRSAFRFGNPCDGRDDYIGFRVARTHVE
jgi:formylglycine-generating enzyme required for sulfatase activity